MKIKNYTRPLYSTYLEDNFVTIFKKDDWRLLSLRKESKIFSDQTLKLEMPLSISSNSKILAILSDKNILFYDKDLNLINKIKNKFYKFHLIKFVKDLNLFVLLDSINKLSFSINVDTFECKILDNLKFLKNNFLEFKDFDFLNGKYFFLNQSKPQVTIFDINNFKSSNFIKFGRGGFGKVRNPSSILIVNKKIYINDLHNYLIQKFDSNGKYINQIGKKGDGDFEFDLAYSTSYNEKKNNLICSDFNNDRVVSFDLNLNNFKVIADGKYSKGFFRRPSGIAFDSRGRCYVTNRSSGNIFLLNRNLKFISNCILPNPLKRPACIGIFYRSKDPYIAIIERQDLKSSMLAIYKIINNSTSFKLEKKLQNLNINDPQDMVVAQNGIIYIADTLNRRILRVDSIEETFTEVDLSKISQNPKILPKTVAINEKGEVFTADFDNLKIFKFDEMLNYQKKIDLGFLKKEHKVLRAIGFCKNKIFICTRGKNQVLFSNSERDLSNNKIEFIKENWNHPVKVVSFKDSVYFADKENDRVLFYNTISKKIF